jgi:protease IV
MDNTSQPQGYQQPPVYAQSVPQPYPPPKTFPLARFVAVFLAFCLVFSLLANVVLVGAIGAISMEGEDRVQEKFYSHEKNGADKVAILTISGVISGGDAFIKKQVDYAIKEHEEGRLKAIVLEVDSPGGTMTGSDEIYHQLLRLKEAGIHLVVSMGGIAASGGYYVSMVVGETPRSIFAEPTTWTGSIGVIMPHYDLSELLKSVGVKVDSVASHPLKDMSSFTRPMTEKEREIFQKLIADAFDRFKDVVKNGRPFFKANPTALDELATGQVFTADQAKEYKLIDEIGYLDAAIDRAIELAGLNKNNVRVVKYKPELSLVNLLLGAEARGRSNSELATLLDATTPRAYYLYTSLPSQ